MLLVSVRTKQEIDAAISGGADIVDLKEPRKGALAPSPAKLWWHAADRCRETGQPSFSAALGESNSARRIAGSVPGAFQFAKVGPSGIRTADGLLKLWKDVRSQLQPSIELVAVAYADHQASDCLPPVKVFQLASEFGLSRCLIDTFIKDSRSSIDHLGSHGLATISDIARESSLWWALAGSITLAQLAPTVEQMVARKARLPDCLGVRGDVCDSGRTGQLEVQRVRDWKRRVATLPNRVLSNS